MKQSILFTILFTIFLVGCGGSGSGTSITPDPDAPAAEAQVLVDAAADSVTVDDILGTTNTSLDTITDNLVLPRTAENGATIEWASSDESIISSDGTINRPTYTEGDKEVTLTATFSIDSDTLSDARVLRTSFKKFILNVKAMAINSTESVAEAKADLTFDTIKNANTAIDAVISNLSLSTSGTLGTTISWSSSNTAVIATDGTVTRPAYSGNDTAVTLTATISKSGFSDTKQFSITVIKAVQTDSEKIAEAKTALDFDTIKNANTSIDAVISNLSLSTSGTLGTTISWSSSNTAVIATDGTVTRPAYSGNDTVVTLTATISISGSSDTEQFSITVIKAAQTDLEKIAEAKTALDFDTIKNANAKADKIRHDLSLPSSGSNSTTISWGSSDTSFIANNGTVTRPDNIDGDQTITLTATIGLNSDSDTEIFTLKMPYKEKFVDGNGTYGITPTANNECTRMPVLMELNGTLYCILYKDGGVRNMRFMKYNGDDIAPTWTFIDGGGASDSINKDTNKDAWYPDLAVLNGELYAVWTEMGGTWSTRVAKYSGDDSAPSWTFVDGDGVNGINYDVTDGAMKPKAAVLDNKLYVTWTEFGPNANQTRVAVYGNTPGSWTFVDGNDVDGINYDVNQDAEEPELAIFNNKLYATWSETDGTAKQVRFAEYNGNDSAPAWTFKDGNIATGLNYNTVKDGTTPFMKVYNSNLYLTWSELDASAKTQIRVKKFDGTNWTFVDGGGVSGLNIDTTKSGSEPFMTTYNSTLFLTWLEYNGVAYQLHLKEYDGTNWTDSDGGGASGINYDDTKSASSHSMYTFEDGLYIMFEEDNAAAYQVRAKAW